MIYIYNTLISFYSYFQSTDNALLGRVLTTIAQLISLAKNAPSLIQIARYVKILL